MATIIHLDDMNFNDNVPDYIGSLWYVDGLTGWDSPAQRTTSTPLPGSHGEVLVENLYAARTMAITGICKAASGDLMFQSMYYLAGQTNAMAQPVNFSVEEDIRRWCSVYRAGEVKMAYIGTGAFRFEANFKANDPMKYGWTAKTVSLAAGTPQVLVNEGSVRTYPMVTFTNAGSAHIVNGTQVWSTTAAVPAGLVANMKTMTAMVGGTTYFHLVNPASQWIYLEPGNNTVQSTMPATVVYWDAWV